MVPSPRPPILERGFVVLMVALCSVLTVLQFRWTGEIAKAERTRLNGGVEEQARRMTSAFDDELSSHCSQLVPKTSEVTGSGIEPAFIRRLKAWKASHPAPLFKRLAVAVPNKENGVTLYELKQREEAFALMEWPAGWEELRSNLSRKSAEGTAPYDDRTGLLIEFPIMSGGGPPGSPPGPPPDSSSGPPSGPPPGVGGPPGTGGKGPPAEGNRTTSTRGGGEAAWMILELDESYVRETWLPNLTRIYLNAGGNDLRSVRVVSNSAPAVTFFETGGEVSSTGEKVIRLPFNRQGRSSIGAASAASGKWTLEIRNRTGELERMVAASRTRNLSLAILLNVMIVVAGGLLVRQTRRSRLLAEERMRFVASVSHELRTPLTVIRGAAYNLQRGVVTEPGKVKQYAGLVSRHAEDLGEMIGQLLDFASAKKASLVDVTEPVSIADVLREAMEATETETALCRVEATLPESLPMIRGDAKALRRVFQNLLLNAAKHGGSGGWIGLSAELSSTGDRIEVRVRDRGPGIPERELVSIFSPFYRGQNALASLVRGSGLGLSLAKEIVEAHGGKIFANNEPRGGAVFTVQLPVSPDPI